MWIATLISRMAVLHFMISIIFTYFIMKALPTKQGRYAVFLFTFAYNSFAHIHRLYYHYMEFYFDWGVLQMLLTLRLVMLAYDIHDGTLKEEELHHKFAKANRLQRFPSFLEILGYCFFYPSLISGPTFTMKEYLDFIEGKIFADCEGKRVPPGAIKKALSKLFIGTLWLPFLALGGYFNIFFCSEDQFREWPFFYKIAFHFIACFLFKPMYYYAWTLAEGSQILIGYGYNGSTIDPVTKEKKLHWNRAMNINIFEIEFPKNVSTVALSWNIGVNRFLKYYVYTRLLSSGFYKLANPVTYFISSFWHGFYPGYYCFFVFGPIIMKFESMGYKTIRPYFLEEDQVTPKSYYWIYEKGKIVATYFVITYALGSFLTLSWYHTWRTYSAIYFYGHILIALFGLVCVVLSLFQKKDVVRKKVQ